MKASWNLTSESFFSEMIWDRFPFGYKTDKQHVTMIIFPTLANWENVLKHKTAEIGGIIIVTSPINATQKIILNIRLFLD